MIRTRFKVLAAVLLVFVLCGAYLALRGWHSTPLERVAVCSPYVLLGCG